MLPLRPIRLPRITAHYTAYAVLYYNKMGRMVMRGIFSEETPTVVGGMRGGPVRTKCVARAASTKNYARAADLLQKMLGWEHAHEDFLTQHRFGQ